MSDTNTPDRILSIARDLLAAEGLSGLSFDAIARKLGRTKQAVLYWYPSKRGLLAAMYLPALQAEADAVASALAGQTGRDPAIAAFVRAVAAFHLSDLDRFRLMYLVPQTTRGKAADWGDGGLVDQVHPVTDALYGALADRLGAGGRAEAVAIHSAVLGLVLMHGLAASVQDPLKHPPDVLIDALIASLTGPR